LKRDKVVKIARLGSCKNFVSKREKFIFDAFVDLQPVERFETESDMSGFRSLNNSTSKRVLNLLEPVKLTVWKVMIKRVIVVKFRVKYGGGNGAGCFEVRYGRIQVWPGCMLKGLGLDLNLALRFSL